VATINGEQTRTTSVIKKTLNPYWNESFDMYVSPRPRAVQCCIIQCSTVLYCITQYSAVQDTC
jgi:Ca2+-dependent lipid-binding protein